MKFAQYLTNNCVPEWNTQYLDYKLGKKKLKKITKFTLKTPGVDAEISPDSPIASINTSFQLPSPALDPVWIAGKSRDSTGGSAAAAAAASSAANERTPLLEPISEQEMQRNDQNQQSQHSQHNQQNQNKHSGSDESPFAKLRRKSSILNFDVIARIASRKSFNESVALENTFEAEKTEFIDWLLGELNKINDFFKQKEAVSVERFHLLQDQIRQLQMVKGMQSGQNASVDDYQSQNVLLAARNEDQNNQNDIDEIIHGSHQNNSNTQQNNHQNKQQNIHHLWNLTHTLEKRDYKTTLPSYSQAKRQLKHAFFEYYRSLELLKSYRTLNQTACRKIIKKFDKVTGSKESKNFLERVGHSYFVESNLLDDLVEKVESLYTIYLENGNRKKAIDQLRTSEQSNHHYKPLFFAGVCLGVAIPLLIFTIIRGVNNFGRVKESHILFQIWGGILIASLCGLMFTVHFIVWDKFKINYKFIFNFDLRSALDYSQYAFLPSLTIALGCLTAYFSFDDAASWPARFLPRDMPWIFVGLVLFILLNPVPVLYYKSRRWVQIALWRLFFSGLYPVEFQDFFIGDIFCSLTYSISNISFFICLYATEWGKPVSCGSSRSRILGFLSTLPSIWRWLQCLRRFYDTREGFPHLANMAKYTCSIVYYMSLSLYRIHKSNPNKAAFITFAIVNSLFSSFWDIFMDWSLLQMESKNWLLRNNLGYKNYKWWYYFAMVFNLLIRFQWIFYVFFSTKIQQSSLTSFFIAFAELLRRFVWVFFRLENEHCTNVDLLKASRETSFPFPVTNKEENFEDTETGAASAASSIAVPVVAAVADSEYANDNEVFDITSDTSHNSNNNRPYSFFRTLSRAINVAHIKDFQRPVKRSDIEENSSDEDEDEDGR